ncbi:MAG: diaminopimelate epimerase [Bacteroidetes bacterium]|nr:diaminopimelate epimerase [Bacteroidota bacterium]
MTVKFYKYQGTGNDFIMIDNRTAGLRLKRAAIEKLCDRRFGIGADGLILLEQAKGYDFKMVYYNSDGRESSMCGNGGRCLIQFAHELGLIKKQCRFMAIDGEHEGEILKGGIVSLKMQDVKQIKTPGLATVMNTGSPHYVMFVSDVQQINLVEEARKIRYSKTYAKEGINVNFVQLKTATEIFVRTYERGVEDETLSCGTGVVAACLATAMQSTAPLKKIKVQTKGGKLEVKFTPVKKGFENIYLLGPAQKVFKGRFEI